MECTPPMYLEKRHAEDRSTVPVRVQKYNSRGVPEGGWRRAGTAIYARRKAPNTGIEIGGWVNGNCPPAAD